MYKKYCLGLVFNIQKNHVLLTSTSDGNEPLNGVYGVAQPDEALEAAMTRICRDESGLVLSDWELIATFEGADYNWHCFKVFTDDIFKIKPPAGKEVTPYRFGLDTLFRIGNPRLVPLICHALQPFTCAVSFQPPRT